MLKNIVKLEKKIGDRIYHFICDPDSPVGEIHDALHEMKDFVVNKMIEIHKGAAAQNEEKKE